jgi:hypothetical protein
MHLINLPLRMCNYDIMLGITKCYKRTHSLVALNKVLGKMPH